MHFTDPGQLRVSGPADLLAVVPYLLGYAPDPANSLVLLALTDARLVAAVRTTLPDRDETLQPLREAVDRLAATVPAHGDTDVILIGYGQQDRVERAVAAARSVLHAVHLSVLEALRVAESRYFPLGPDRPEGPPEGVAFDPRSSVAAATAVWAGMVAFPDRQALAATLAPGTGAARAGMHAATVTACQAAIELVNTALDDATEDADSAGWDSPAGRRMLAAALRRIAHTRLRYRRGQPVDDEDAALVTLLLDVPGAGCVAARHTSGQPWQIAMWSDLVRRAEPAFTAMPACLLTLAALHAGQGALADIAVRRALTAQQDNRLAQALAVAVACGIDPDTLSAVMAG
jgi:hypothetical protein